MKYKTILITSCVLAFANPAFSQANLQIKLDMNNINIVNSAEVADGEQSTTDYSNAENLQFNVDSENIKYSNISIYNDCLDSPIRYDEEFNHTVFINSDFILDNRLNSPNQTNCVSILELDFIEPVKFVSIDVTGQPIEFIATEIAEMGEYPFSIAEYSTKWTFRQEQPNTPISVTTVFNSMIFQAENQAGIEYFNGL